MNRLDLQNSNGMPPLNSSGSRSDLSGVVSNETTDRVKQVSTKELNNVSRKGGMVSGLVGKFGGRFAMFRGGVDEKLHESDRKLQELSQGPEFGQLLSILSKDAQIINAIKSKIGDCIGSASANFLGNALANFESFPTLIESMFSQAVVNVAQAMRKQSANASVTPLNVISYLINHVTHELQDIDLKLEAIKIEQQALKISPVEITKILASKKKELKVGLSNQLLDLMYPGGINDLPMNYVFKAPFIRSIIWKLVRKATESLVDQISETLEDGKKIESSSNQVKDQSRILAKASSNFSLAYLSKHSDAVAMLITNKLSVVESMDEDGKKEFKDYVSAQILDFSTVDPLRNNSEDITQVRLLIEKGIGNILNHAFTNLAKDKPAGSDANVYAINRVLGELKIFMNENHKKISKLSKRLKKQGVENPFTHPECIALFAPLSKKLQVMIGLVGFSSLSNNVIEWLFKEYLAEELSKHYSSSLVPLNDIYTILDGASLFQVDPSQDKSVKSTEQLQRQQKLKAFPGGDKLAALCEKAGEYVGNEIPQIYEDADKRSEMSSKIALLFVKVVATENQLQILNELEKGQNFSLNDDVTIELKNLQEIYQWFSNFVSNNIALAVGDNAIKNGRDNVKHWGFVKNLVDDLLVQMILNVAGNADNNLDINSALISRLSNLLVSFNADFGTQISKSYATLKSEGKDPAANQEFIDLFNPLNITIKDILGFKKGSASEKLPIPEAFVEFGEYLLGKFAPQLFASLYSNFNSSEEVAADHVKQLDRIKKIIVQQSESEDTAEKSIKTLDNISTLISEKLVEALKDFILKDKVVLDESFLEKVSDRLSTSLNSIILHTIANHLEVNPEKSPIEHINGIVNNLISCLLVYSPEEEERINNSLKISDKVEQKKILKGLFQKRTSDLLSVIRPNNENDQMIPLPPAITEMLWGWLESSLIPDFLLSILVEKNKAQKIAENKAADMNKITGSNLRSEVCQLTANFISEFLPAFTKLDHENIALDLYDLIAKKLKEAGTAPNAKNVDQFLKDNKEAIIKDIGKSILQVSLDLNSTRPITREILKSILTDVLNGVTFKIDAIENPSSEKYDKDFLTKQGIQILRLIKDQFGVLNAVAKKHKSKVFYEIDDGVLVRDLFESQSLHLGVPHSDEALRAQARIKQTNITLKNTRLRLETMKKFPFLSRSVAQLKAEIRVLRANLRRDEKIVAKARYTTFIQPLSKKILESSGIVSIDSLPFPSPIKEILWEQLQDNILPSALMNLFQMAIDPHTLNQLIITALDNYNAAEEISEKALEVTEPKDAIQIELDAVCGQLFQQIGQIMPNSITNAALKFDKIKNMTAEKMGKIIRQQLSEKLSLQKIIEKGLPPLLETLNKSEIIDNEDAYEAAALRKIYEEEAALSKVRADLESTAYKFIISQISDKFMIKWNKRIEKVLGTHTAKVKNFFNWIGFRIAYTILKHVFMIAGAPVVLVGWLAKKFLMRHIAKHVDHVLNSLHMPIHEDLLYKLLDEVYLKKLSPSPNPL